MGAAMPISFSTRESYPKFFQHKQMEFDPWHTAHMVCAGKIVAFININLHWYKRLIMRVRGLNARLWRAKLWLQGYQSKFYVNVYSIDRCYGGPEEGGWWYDAGMPFDGIQRNSFGCDTQEEAERIQEWLTKSLDRYQPQRNRYSVVGGADIDVFIEAAPPQPWPAERPYYC
jgi:hypothetical protein